MMGEYASRPLSGPQGVCVGLSEQSRRPRSTGVQRGGHHCTGPGGEEAARPGPDHEPHTQGREREEERRGGVGRVIRRSMRLEVEVEVSGG